jgi:hypothetical protein
MRHNERISDTESTEGSLDSNLTAHDTQGMLRTTKTYILECGHIVQGHGNIPNDRIIRSRERTFVLSGELNWTKYGQRYVLVVDAIAVALLTLIEEASKCLLNM